MNEFPRVCVVTGAGSGIGRAVAAQFASRGWTVVLVGRTESSLNDTFSLLPPTTPPSSVLVTDVTAAAAPATVAAALLERYGHVDVLVNNAGALLLRPFEEMDAHALDDMLNVNVRAPYLLTLALLPLLREGHDATVVNIGSAAGLLYRPGQSAYGMSKAAVHYLTHSLAVELAPAITVNGIIPGPVATEIHGGDHSPDSPLARIIRTLPAARAGRADEIATWVTNVATPDNRWMTGALIPVDGGRVISPPDRPLERQ